MKPTTSSVEGQKRSISRRANKAFTPFLTYFKAIGAGMANRWTKDNPDGNLVLAIAENVLMQDILVERLQRASQEVEINASTLMYADFKGTLQLRGALAGLVNHTFMKGVDVDPKNLVVSAGAGSIVDNLFYAICDPGDGVLIPAPYYPAFDNDLEVKNDAKPIAVYLDFEADLGTQLDAAAQKAEEEGRPVRALLLTNPNNPLGTVYSHDTQLSMLKWCLKKEVHLVSDEIYALSVWGEGAVFESMETTALSLDGPEKELSETYLHTVFGLSKDFGASGLRIGALHTRNASVMGVMGNVAYFCGVSNLTQQTVTKVLQDLDFIDEYVKENARRMRESYEGFEGILKAGGVKHVTANSAMFCWIDLRALLSENTWEAETALWEELIGTKKVLFTPGKFCHAPAPGYFRCCWAWLPAEGLAEAGRRVVALQQEKTNGNGPVAQ